MSWRALIYYSDKVDEIGGRNSDHDEDLHYKIKKYVRKNCQRIEVFRNDQTIYPEGIKLIKKHTKI